MIDTECLPSAAGQSAFLGQLAEKTAVRAAAAPDYVLAGEAAESYNQIAAGAGDNLWGARRQADHAQRSSQRGHGNPVSGYRRRHRDPILGAEEVHLMAACGQSRGGL